MKYLVRLMISMLAMHTAIASAVEIPYQDYEGFENYPYKWDYSSSQFRTYYNINTGTGPADDYEGNYSLYAYGSSYTRRVLDRNLDFSYINADQFSFAYHMYGSDILSLSVDIFDGTSWSTGVWSKVGEQHFSNNDPWSVATIDISHLSGVSNAIISLVSSNTYGGAEDTLGLDALTLTGIYVNDDNDYLADEWEIEILGSIDQLDDFSFNFYRHRDMHTWSEDYEVECVVDLTSSALAGTLSSPAGSNYVFNIVSNNIYQITSPIFDTYSEMISAGWSSGTYNFSFFKQDSSTLQFSMDADSLSFPYIEVRLDGYLFDDLETTQTVHLSSSGSEWSILELYEGGTNLVYTLENTNSLDTVVLGEDSVLEYGTDYTVTVYAQYDGVPTFISTASLSFSTKIKNEDHDSMDDEWEQLIVDANPSDSITSVHQVHWYDDFDNDGLSNAEEYAINSNPTLADSGDYNTIEKGLEMLNALVGENRLRGHISLAEKCFHAVVQTDPDNYEARLYLAFVRLINQMNNVELDALIDQFGFVLNIALNPVGDFNFADAPEFNWIMDTYGTNLLNTLDASLADLNAIPANWTGTVEVSTNDLPIDETLYIDLADVTFAKAALTGLYAMLNTGRANALNIDYEAMLALRETDMETITVDGSITDWQGIDPCLLALEETDGLQAVSTAMDDDYLYVLVEYEGIDFGGDGYFGFNGDFNLHTNMSLGLDLWKDSYYGVTNWTFSVGDESITASNVTQVITNGVMEISIPIPTGLEPDFFYPNELSYNFYSAYNISSGELLFPDNAPADELLAAHTNLFSEIRDETVLQEAKTNWMNALDLFLLADDLAEQRIDSLMHFIEYNPAESADRQEILSRVTEFRDSFDAPVLMSTTNTLYGDLLEKNVFLGAYFTPDYLLRDLLPEFDFHLAKPLLDSFPDYTFGGIFPDNTSSIFMRDYRMFNDEDAGLAGALDNYDLLWSTGGGWYDQWFAQELNTHDGNDAAQSSPASDVETSWVETTVNGDGTISFWWAVSSEQDYDWLRFYVDNELRRAITGEDGWAYVSVPIEGAGAHALRWEYAKDKSLSEGQDCGWLDQVVWMSGGATLSFNQWCLAHGLDGDLEGLMLQDRNDDGIPNAFEYAFGTNLQAETLLLRIVSANGEPVIEIPAREDITIPYMDIRVVGSTNLLGGESEWIWSTYPATNQAGKPAHKEWHELGNSADHAFFRIEAELR